MKVLLLDEAEDFRVLVAQILAIEWPSIEIDEYGTVEQAVAAGALERHDHDVVLLDGQALDGYRGAGGDLSQVIVLSDTTDSSVEAHAITSGAAAFLRKQEVDRKRLNRIVHEALQAGVSRTQPNWAKTCDLATELDRCRGQRSKAATSIPGYTLRTKIGQGGMASVFLGSRDRDNQTMVLKVMHGQLYEDAAFLARFVQEYNLLSRIDNPYVVRIFEQGATDDHIFIAMEYFPRGNLKQYLKTMTPVRAVRIFSHIVKGLGVVHSFGIAHRDLKPENIMFRDDGSLALVDFGIAKRMDDTLQVTRDGEVCGTPYYMSPEQVSGGNVDYRCDIYAAGAILFEMLEAKKIYTGSSAIEVAAKHVYAPIPRLSETNNHLQPIIDRSLAKDPAQRYQTAREALSDAVQALKTMRECQVDSA